jgi:hypothetical protein
MKIKVKKLNNLFKFFPILEYDTNGKKTKIYLFMWKKDISFFQNILINTGFFYLSKKED